MSKTKLLLALAGITAVGAMGVAGYFGFTTVQALVESNGRSTLIENLAAKFNLNSADVEQVFEDTRKQEVSNRLEESVKEGDITAEQKTQILAKIEEHQAAAEAILAEKLTATERADKMEQLREDLEDWADTNDIPLRYLGMGMMGGRGGMMGGERGRGMMR